MVEIEPGKRENGRDEERWRTDRMVIHMCRTGESRKETNRVDGGI